MIDTDGRIGSEARRRCEAAVVGSPVGAATAPSAATKNARERGRCEDALGGSLLAVLGVFERLRLFLVDLGLSRVGVSPGVGRRFRCSHGRCRGFRRRRRGRRRRSGDPLGEPTADTARPSDGLQDGRTEAAVVWRREGSEG